MQLTAKINNKPIRLSNLSMNHVKFTKKLLFHRLRQKYKLKKPLYICYEIKTLWEFERHFNK